MSKSNINTTNTLNQTQIEQQHLQQQQHAKFTPFSPASTQSQTMSPPNGQTRQSNQTSSVTQGSQITTYNNTVSKVSTNPASNTQSINGTGLFSQGQNNQNLNHNGATGVTQVQKKSVGSTQSSQYKRSLPSSKHEEEKIMPAPQVTQQTMKPMQSYETGILGQRNLTQKPKAPQAVQQLPQKQIERPSDGEKSLNKRHQMRLTSGDQRKETPHNITRSMIDEGSEDFTNIEERLQEDTRISCRNAVASSLNNVSQIIRHVQQQQRQQNLRNRRGTTQSNRSGCQSNQQSKEETFETSSFFDEGVANKHLIGTMQATGMIQSPHRCNQVEGYNIPTIFNTLMFGIDQSKVSENIRESFSTISARGRPSSQLQSTQNPPKQQQSSQQTSQRQSTQPQKQIAFSHKDASATTKPSKDTKKEQPKDNKLSQFITKVDKSPIMVFDQQQHTQPSKNSQQSRNQERIRNDSNHQKQQSASPKSPERKSQLSMAAQQQVEAVDSLNTEILQRHSEEELKSSLHEMHSDSDNEEGVAPAQNIQDFQSSELHRNHLIQTLQSLQYIKTLPPVNKNEIRKRQVTLPPPKSSHIKKTLIFDLDETLVHCIDDIENNPCDEIINVTFPNGETVQAGINVRPYALECLKKANENYQVVVFTASHKAYADVVLDSLDPKRTLIQYRLYRDHCIRTEEGIYIKDLRIITNRNLRDLIIVDNAVYSFGYQLDNGIPIIPFYDDKSDEELMHLIFYFNCLANCSDVREQNRKAFQLKDLQEIDIQEYLQSMMSNQNVKQVEEDEEE